MTGWDSENGKDAQDRSELRLDDRVVSFSSLDRPLWPTIGSTKRHLLEYYLRVADVLLPHLVNRPATLHRFPEGMTGRHFYQTRCPSHPEWIRTQRMHVFGSGKDVETAVIDDLPSLAWAVNLSTIEFHPYLSHADRLDVPTALVFDLDPGRGAGLLDAARLALVIRDLLQRQGLASFVKTSGGKGIHVHVPLTEGQGYDESKAFAREVARVLTERSPEDVTDVMSIGPRAGKVFIDWSQNDAGKSTVAPYSLRGAVVPTVAAPVEWEEVERAVGKSESRAQDLVFTILDVLRRLDRRGDPFEALDQVQHGVPEQRTL
jgi:bifunctional non-homologous end joining protein LigD